MLLNSGSCHHIVPKNRGGYSWKDKNTYDMWKKKHRALHLLFWNASPLQQIQRISTLDNFLWNKGREVFELIHQQKQKDQLETYNKWIVVNSNKLWLPYSHHSIKPGKIKEADLTLFDKTIHTEDKIREILKIAESTLTDKCKQDILNILS